MEDKALELYKFIQERYLWQFYSRSWDRDENISAIFDKYSKLLSGEKVENEDTLKDKAYYAEAKTVADETKKKFDWLSSLGKEQIQLILGQVKEKLVDVTITRSQNGELHNPNY